MLGRQLGLLLCSSASLRQLITRHESWLNARPRQWHRPFGSSGSTDRVPSGMIFHFTSEVAVLFCVLSVTVCMQARDEYFRCVAASGISQSIGPAVPLACKEERKAFEACCKDSWVGHKPPYKDQQNLNLFRMLDFFL
jgi:hypothetical protein